MAATISCTVTGGDCGIPEIAAMIKTFQGKELTIGVHGDEAERDEGGKITNPALAAVHEFGDKRGHVPARPFLRPTYEAKKEELDQIIQQGVDACVASGGTHDPLQEVKIAGVVMVGAVKKRIQDGLSPPITEGAKRSRARRLKTKEAKDKAMGAATPLIDSSQLINSITSKISKAGTHGEGIV